MDGGLLGEACIDKEAAMTFFCMPAGTRAGGEEGSIVREGLPLQFCHYLAAQNIFVPESL